MPLVAVRSLQDLAATPPWPEDRTRALAGQVRGSLLKDWGVHVERRWGRGAPAALVDALGYDLPIRPELGAWYPVWVQLRLTELIVANHLDGDAQALIAVIWEDATRSAGPIATAALKLVGPVRILRRAPGSFSGLYDRVDADAVIDDHRIRVHFSGTEHVDQPTWQLLQAISLTGLAQMAQKTSWTLAAGAPVPGEFTLALTL